MGVTEDDEADPGESAAKSRQPTLPRPGVVDHAYPQAGQVEFGGFAGSPCTDVGAVVVAEDGMHWRVGRQLLEYARHADVAACRITSAARRRSATPGGQRFQNRGACVSDWTTTRIESSFQPYESCIVIAVARDHGAQTSPIP